MRIYEARHDERATKVQDGQTLLRFEEVLGTNVFDATSADYDGLLS
jgi:hypothetical protein